MKLISMNVNGIRAAQKKGLEGNLLKEAPDVICFQEVKARPEQVDLHWDSYHSFWMNSEKAGYAGVATFCKEKPLNVIKGLGSSKHDHVGRIITVEFEEYFVSNIYSPNSQRGLERLDYRVGEWEPDLRNFLRQLDEKKPLIFCGDLNVAHREIDLKNPKPNKNNAGFTEQEREAFSALLEQGFIDTFRHFNQEPENYTWWTYRNNARERNIGWRLDYVCVSKRLKSKLISAKIHTEIYGSDHCPVSIEIT